LEIQFRFPSPAPAISLNELAFTLQLGRIWAQQLRHSFDCVPPIIPDHVRVHCNRYARIGVAQLLLYHLRSCSRMQEQARVRVTERVFLRSTERVLSEGPAWGRGSVSLWEALFR
jgi:hypothetical protein